MRIKDSAILSFLALRAVLDTALETGGFVHFVLRQGWQLWLYYIFDHFDRCIPEEYSALIAHRDDRLLVRGYLYLSDGPRVAFSFVVADTLVVIPYFK